MPQIRNNTKHFFDRKARFEIHFLKIATDLFSFDPPDITKYLKPTESLIYLGILVYVISVIFLPVC